MEKSQPFVIPAGVTFQVSDAGLIIENAGDVVLHTTFGRTLSRVVSRAGDVELHGAIAAGALVAAGSVRVEGTLAAESVQAGGAVTVTGTAGVGSMQAGGDAAFGGGLTSERVEAGGGLTVQGDLTASELVASGDVAVHGAFTVRRADVGGSVTVHGPLGTDLLQAAGLVSVAGPTQVGTIRAGDIELTGQPITARGLQARNAIHLGPGKIQIDAMIAGEVHVDARTAGRATIIESQNDLGTNAIKGGFRLADYAEMFGDPAGYLRERGLSAPGEAWSGPEASGRPAPPAPVAAPLPVAAPAAVVVPVAAPVAPQVVEEPVAAPAAVVAPVEPPQVDVAAPVTSVEEDAPDEIEPEPIDADEPAASATRAPHPLHDQLVDAVEKIAERYNEGDLPPAVSHLRSLIENRSYDEIRAEITSIWSDLVKFHQKHGLRIQHQVTTTFNTINSLVKKM